MSKMRPADLRRVGVVKAVQLCGFSVAAERFGVSVDAIRAAYEIETGDVLPRVDPLSDEAIAMLAKIWEWSEAGGAPVVEFVASVSAMFRLNPEQTERVWSQVLGVTLPADVAKLEKKR